MTEKAVRQVKGYQKLTWSLANIGRIIMIHTMSAFLLVFYTDVFGLHPAVVGTLFLVARIADGFNDPIMGYVVDHMPQTRWGKFRPTLLVGVVLSALVFVAIFAGPELSPVGKVVWAYVTYLLFGFVADLVTIPSRAMLPNMTQHIDERNTLSSLGAMMGALTYIVVAAISISAVNSFATPRVGWSVMSIIYASIAVVLITVFVFTVGERVQDEKVDESYSIRDVYRLIWNNKPLLILVGTYVFSDMGIALLGPSAVLFFKYNVGREELFGITSLLNAVVMVVGMSLFPVLARRFGRKQLYWASAFLTLLSCAALFFTPVANVGLILGLSCFLGLGLGPPTAIAQAMIADATDYAEYQNGTRSEGVTYAAITFGTKITGGLAGAIQGYVLAATGYVANAPQQTRAALIGISSVKHWLVAATALLSAVFISMYPLTEERMAEVQAELARRKERPEAA